MTVMKQSKDAVNFLSGIAFQSPPIPIPNKNKSRDILKSSSASFIPPIQFGGAPPNRKSQSGTVSSEEEMETKENSMVESDENEMILEGEEQAKSPSVQKNVGQKTKMEESQTKGKQTKDATLNAKEGSASLSNTSNDSHTEILLEKSKAENTKISENANRQLSLLRVLCEEEEKGIPIRDFSKQIDPEQQFQELLSQPQSLDNLLILHIPRSKPFKNLVFQKSLSTTIKLLSGQN